MISKAYYITNRSLGNTVERLVHLMLNNRYIHLGLTLKYMKLYLLK